MCSLLAYPSVAAAAAPAEEAEPAKPKGCKQDEILAVLGHELGHWHYSHSSSSVSTRSVHCPFCIASGTPTSALFSLNLSLHSFLCAVHKDTT